MNLGTPGVYGQIQTPSEQDGVAAFETTCKGAGFVAPSSSTCDAAGRLAAIRAWCATGRNFPSTFFINK